MIYIHPHFTSATSNHVSLVLI